MVVMRAALFASVALAAGCNVDSSAEKTGGTDIPAGPCGRGVIVGGADDGYQASNVSLVDFDGEVLSSSLISSASESAGLSSPIGGDVVFPNAAQNGETVVVIDRFPASVITWIDVRSGDVSRQLSVATGFASNPHDYYELSPTKAYVPRFEQNGDPGREPFDEGSDVLIVDPSVPTIRGRIDLAPVAEGIDPTLLARGDRAVLSGQRLLVLVQLISRSFGDSGPSQLVVIDTASDEVVEVVELAGKQGCSALALSPRGDEVAVACTGSYEDGVPRLDEAGIVLVALSGPTAVARVLDAGAIGDAPLGFTLEYSGDTTLWFTTLGDLATDEEDALRLVELPSDEATTLRASTPFSLGEVACAPECSVCFATDAADGGHLIRYELDAAGRPAGERTITVERKIGLPPRTLGRF